MTAMPRPSIRDFGFDPSESPYHFAVLLKSGHHAGAVVEERFSFSSTKYGPTVGSGVRMHAVLPVAVLVAVVVVVEVVFVPPPQPSIAPAPATAKIPNARVKMEVRPTCASA